MKIVIEIPEIRKLLKSVNNAFPVEACGLIIGTIKKNKLYFSFVEADYKHNTLSSFRIDNKSIEAIKHGLINSNSFIYGCYHSHILGLAYPSRHDIKAKKQINDYWLIYSVQDHLFSIYKWDGRRFRKEFFEIS